MSHAGKKRLLVVDDEAPIRQLLARVAQRAGFDVETAEDGIDALEKLERGEYAIVIVDLMMPRLSGYELVERISKLKPRPVVLVATAMSNGDVESLDDSMVRRVIKKPFDINALANALVEIAAQVAEKQGIDAKRIAVAPPEAATLPIAPDDEEPSPTTAAEADDEDDPPIADPPPLERD